MAEITRHDDDLASLLLEDGIGERLRFDHARKQWHWWDSHRWRKDADTRALRFVFDAAVRMLATSNSEAKSKALISLLDKSKKESVLGSLAFREPIAMTGEEWDTQPHLLGVTNGVLDLNTLTLTPGDPDANISRSAKVAWNPNATAPVFVDFVQQIMGGDQEMIDYLLSVLGYSLFGHQLEQKFWLWVGSGNNGKGTLAKVVSWVLGDYADDPSAELYMKTRFGAAAASAPRAELVKLQGVRFTWMSEPHGGAFNDELVKAHSGDDPIQARPLYSNDFITFRPTHTINFLTNDPPRVEDVGPSMQRRARMIRFEQDFTAKMDPTLEARMRAEGPGILRLLAGFAKHYAEHGLIEPEKVRRWSAEYIEENDPIARFLSDRCVIERTAESQGIRVYEAYVGWCRENDEEFKSSSGFGMQLSKRFKKTKRMNGIYYKGIALKGAVALAEDA